MELTSPSPLWNSPPHLPCGTHLPHGSVDHSTQSHSVVSGNKEEGPELSTLVLSGGFFFWWGDAVFAVVFIFNFLNALTSLCM